MSATRSRLLGSGAAPARAFGGGAAMVETPGPRLIRAVCSAYLACADGVWCTLDHGHASDWHVGGGWTWTDDGRVDRAPRVGR